MIILFILSKLSNTAKKKPGPNITIDISATRLSLRDPIGFPPHPHGWFSIVVYLQNFFNYYSSLMPTIHHPISVQFNWIIVNIENASLYLNEIKPTLENQKMSSRYLFCHLTEKKKTSALINILKVIFIFRDTGNKLF